MSDLDGGSKIQQIGIIITVILTLLIMSLPVLCCLL